MIRETDACWTAPTGGPCSRLRVRVCRTEHRSLAPPRQGGSRAVGKRVPVGPDHLLHPPQASRPRSGTCQLTAHRGTPSASIGAPQPKWTACSRLTMPMPHARCEVANLFPALANPIGCRAHSNPPLHQHIVCWALGTASVPATFSTHQLTHQHISVSVVRGHSPCLSQPVTFGWSGLDRPAGHLASALLPAVDAVRLHQSMCISELPPSLLWPPP